MHDDRRKKQVTFFDRGHIHDLFLDFDDAIDAWYLARERYADQPTERREAIVRATEQRIAEAHGQLWFALETERAWRTMQEGGAE